MNENNLKFENQKERSEEILQLLEKEYLELTMSEEQLSKLKEKMEEAKRENRRERNKKHIMKLVAAAATFIIAFMVLPNTSAAIAHAMEQIPVVGRLVKVVTFRDYKYEDVQHQADVEVPELVIDLQPENIQLRDSLEKTTDEINAEIQKITEELLEEFKIHMSNEAGYEELIVKSEVVASTEKYFTLKLISYQAEASGYEKNYYYTINLRTGEQLQLKDIFVDDSNYIGRISEYIKTQMEQQMKEDEQKIYWIDTEFDDMNFKTITEETSFYLNEKNNVVISFGEGDVAPMYMGIVEFEIPEEIIGDIRKNFF